MANLSSAKKMVRVNKRRTKRNQVWRNKLKETVKSFRTKVESGKKIKESEVKLLHKVIDKSAKRNVIHPNKAARLKSRLTSSK